MTQTLPAAPRTPRRGRTETRGPLPGSGLGPRRDARERLLATFSDSRGGRREVLARQGICGSVLVVDRDADGGEEGVLVAHLFAEEPAGNADLICALYVSDCQARDVRCARHSDEHEHSAPVPESGPEVWAGVRDGCVEAPGGSFALDLSRARMSIPELRWLRSHGGAPEAVSVRDVVAAVQSYEPVLTLTMRGLALRGEDHEVSTSVLRAELARVLESPIVLNRRLREIVVASVGGRDLSMSEIAIRCGRTKRDRNGNVSGDTSWLARRLGLLADAGQASPTPWIHSDVLGLIARRGLAISPREVEAS